MTTQLYKPRAALATLRRMPGDAAVRSAAVVQALVILLVLLIRVMTGS